MHPLRRVAFSLLLMQQKELLAGRKEEVSPSGVVQTMPGAGGRTRQVGALSGSVVPPGGGAESPHPRLQQAMLTCGQETCPLTLQLEASGRTGERELF